MEEISLKQLVLELKRLPNIRREIDVPNEKRELTNRRSYLFGFGRKQ